MRSARGPWWARAALSARAVVGARRAQPPTDQSPDVPGCWTDRRRLAPPPGVRLEGGATACQVHPAASTAWTPPYLVRGNPRSILLVPGYGQREVTILARV